MQTENDFVQADVIAVNRIGVVRRILDVICETTGMGFAAVARVTDDRWIACAVEDHIDFGLKAGGELDLKTTICDEIRISHEAVIIDDVPNDPAFCNHQTPAKYGFRSYISVPIYKEGGEFFGTLCAIDPEPHQLKTRAVIETFRLFADLIGMHLDIQDRLSSNEIELLDEREQGRLREQFIAVLGHDLRNPLSSISAGAAYLQKAVLDAKGHSAATLITRSVSRMVNLINNLTDFAQSRLGGGFRLGQSDNAELKMQIEQVVSETRMAWPDRRIEAMIALDAPIGADAMRVAQLLSNLIANALTHGAKREAVKVRVASNHEGLVVSVANCGDPIPRHRHADLFKPFVRGGASPDTANGLGLGLYIVHEIVRAHGGTVDVSSTAAETCFTAHFPVLSAEPAGVDGGLSAPASP